LNRIDFCRTRYIDDTLCKALQAGIDQVVILGAGFDAHAYRAPGIDHVHVFELDLPALIGDHFVSTK
jgi:methyltransferase (TIGR00027 family)